MTTRVRVAPTEQGREFERMLLPTFCPYGARRCTWLLECVL